MSTDCPSKLTAECADFKETATGIAITIKLDGETLDTDVAHHRAPVAVVRRQQRLIDVAGFQFVLEPIPMKNSIGKLANMVFFHCLILKSKENRGGFLV